MQRFAPIEAEMWDGSGRGHLRAASADPTSSELNSGVLSSSVDYGFAARIQYRG
jgi:hypothetical protein